MVTFLLAAAQAIKGELERAAAAAAVATTARDGGGEEGGVGLLRRGAAREILCGVAGEGGDIGAVLEAIAVTSHPSRLTPTDLSAGIQALGSAVGVNPGGVEGLAVLLSTLRALLRRLRAHFASQAMAVLPEERVNLEALVVGVEEEEREEREGREGREGEGRVLGAGGGGFRGAVAPPTPSPLSLFSPPSKGRR